MSSLEGYRPPPQVKFTVTVVSFVESHQFGETSIRVTFLLETRISRSISRLFGVKHLLYEKIDISSSLSVTRTIRFRNMAVVVNDIHVDNDNGKWQHTESIRVEGEEGCGGGEVEMQKSKVVVEQQ